MTRMTGPDCVVMCNLINSHTHTSLIPPWEDQCEWHRMTRMTGPDCAVMYNLKLCTHSWNNQDDKAGLRGYVQFSKYTHTHTHTHTVTSIIDPPLGGSMRVA